MVEKLNNKKGHTSLELLIVLSLFTVVSIPIFSALNMGFRIFNHENTSYNTIHEQRFALDYVDDLIKHHNGEIDYKDTQVIDSVMRENVLIAGYVKVYRDEEKLLVRSVDGSIQEIAEEMKDFYAENIIRDSAGLVKSLDVCAIVEIDGKEEKLYTYITLNRYKGVE